MRGSRIALSGLLASLLLTPSVVPPAPAAPGTGAEAPRAAADTFEPTFGVTFNAPTGRRAARAILHQVVGSIRRTAAGEHIRITTWNFDDEPTSRALLDARDRGAVVQVVVPNRVDNDTWSALRRSLNRDGRPETFAVQCRGGCRSQTRIMHTKLFLFSRVGDDEQVRFGLDAPEQRDAGVGVLPRLGEPVGLAARRAHHLDDQPEVLRSGQWRFRLQRRTSRHDAEVGDASVAAEGQTELEQDEPVWRRLRRELAQQRGTDRLVPERRRRAHDEQPVDDLVAPAVVREVVELVEAPVPRPLQLGGVHASPPGRPPSWHLRRATALSHLPARPLWTAGSRSGARSAPPARAPRPTAFP